MRIKDFVSILCMMLLLGTLFASCDSNDDSDDIETPLPSLSENEHLLIGEWNAGGNSLFLYSDKTCHTPDGNSGTYTYDESTKELTFTTGWGIRVVKSLDKKTMVLQGVSTSKVWTFKRQNGFIDKNVEALINGKWKMPEDEQVLTINKDRFILSVDGEVVEEGPFVIWSTGNYLLFGDSQSEVVLKHLDYYTLSMSAMKGGSRYAGTYERIE